MRINYLIAIFLVVIVSALTVNAEISDTAAISISLVNQDPDPAIAGDVVEIRLGVENKGGQAVEDLIIGVVEEYPFEMLSGYDTIQTVGTIGAWQNEENMKIVKFKVRVDRDATAGQYELKIKEYEQGFEGTGKQKSLSIDVKNTENAEVIHIDKTTLVPGKETPLKFTVNNVGNAPLRNLRFNWENEDKIILPVGSDNTRYINYVEIGESAELEYLVIADTNADPGLYELDLHLTYDDPISGADTEISTIAGIYVGGETDFDVAFSESSAGETSFSIANIGSNPAFSVSVIIPEQKGWRVTGSNSVIIGNLNKGDYTVASFSLKSASSIAFERTDSKDIQKRLEERAKTQSSEKLNIQVAYTDTRGERNIIEKELSLSPGNLVSSMPEGMVGRPGAKAQNSSSKLTGYIIVLAIVIIGITIYSRYKKKKLANPNFRLKDLFKKKK
ncbi:MAG: COG1361 S-layer family protein [Nanoarchaeota archaeon]|nr:COG1361 S-layer family protein [Nanoarchaeota archaeon]